MGRARRSRRSPHHPCFRLPPSSPPGARRDDLPLLSELGTDLAPCPVCGPVGALTSGWISGADDFVEGDLTLFCKVCGSAVAVMG